MHARCTVAAATLALPTAVGGPAHASFINYSAKEINVKIVYAGVQEPAARSLAYIYERTSPEAKGKKIEPATEGGGKVTFFDFLPLSSRSRAARKIRQPPTKSTPPST